MCIRDRILGLDFGSKTVGVAVSDELLITAQGVEIVRRKSPSKLRPVSYTHLLKIMLSIIYIVHGIVYTVQRVFLKQRYEVMLSVTSDDYVHR